MTHDSRAGGNGWALLTPGASYGTSTRPSSPRWTSTAGSTPERSNPSLRSPRSPSHHPLPYRYEPLLRFGQVCTVPVVPWAPRGSERAVAGIVEVIGRTPGARAVPLANHGALAFSDSVAGSADLIVALEEAAAAEIAGQALGGTRDLPPQALDEVQRSMARAGSPA